MKHIYFYATDNDLKPLGDWIIDNGYLIISKGESARLSSAVCYIKHLNDDNDSSIRFWPTRRRQLGFAEGCFEIDTNKASESLFSAYHHIKKHIKNNYILSDSRRFYVGQDAYNRWLDRKFDADRLFQYDQFVFETSNRIMVVEKIFNTVAEFGLCILPNSITPESSHTLTLTHNSYVVFEQESDLKSRIVGGSTVIYGGSGKVQYEAMSTLHYGNNSKCLFVYINKIKQGYKITVTIDKRIVNEARRVKLINGFSSLKQTVFLYGSVRQST